MSFDGKDSPIVPGFGSSSDFRISPMSDLTINLGNTLRFRRTLTFSSNENTPVKPPTGKETIPKIAEVSPNMRMFKRARSGGSNDSPSSGSKQSFFRRLSSTAVAGKLPSNKENSSSPLKMEFTDAEEFNSPSKFAITRTFSRERCPLEDQDPNSQDSGYSNSSLAFSEDSKSSTFRFVEPVAPRHTDVSPSSGRRSTFRSMSVGSTASDVSDEGFADCAIDKTETMEQDENAQLPSDFNSLFSGTIFGLSKISESPVETTEGSLLQTCLRRSLTENFTPTRAMVRSLTFDDDVLQEKDSTKRASSDDEKAPFLKRRKPNVAKLSMPQTASHGPATAPAHLTKRGTLFDYGFKKAVKFERSFSESEADIKKALQRATSDPNLIGDFSLPFALPLKIGRHRDLKNIDCNTLAELINGKYQDTISSYTIIDCRYPYEYEGGHIKGAINIYTKEQMQEELNEKKIFRKSSTDSNKRNILIFHCEFSSERGPSLSRYLRNADRDKNMLAYPRLDYPEIYLLDGGYSSFFAQRADLCEPRAYCPMNDPAHANELRAMRMRSKSWTGVAEGRKLRSLKRLGLS